MTDAEAIQQLREQIVDFWVDLYQEADDCWVHEQIQRIGPPALQLLMDLLRSQVDADNEGLASYCVNLIIRSQLPGHVDLILKALELRFARMDPGEFREVIFNCAQDFPSCYRDPRLIAAAEAIDQEWHNVCLVSFLQRAGRQSRW